VVERLFSGKSASLLAESQVRTGLRLDGAHIEEVLAPPPNGLMQERSEPRSELTFVHIPGGRFHLGCELQDSDCEKDEGPTRYATVTPFWLGKTEVTVAAYTKCVTAGACTPPRDPGSGCTWNVPGKENHPINCIDWNQATRFCEWIGGRLPTAKEWEYAAKGGRSRIYPWGDELPDRNRANFDSQGTDPVGMHPEGATPQGVLDMAGNLCEWTSSSYSATSKEVRGGSWNVDGRWLRVSYRNGTGASVGGDGTGVRCALSQ
jgi:iron(II)-dependent oxidoreductase